MLDPLTHFLHRGAGQHGAVMLMYHAVTPGTATPSWQWAVSIQQFCRQLDFLADEGYSTPSMAELMATPEHFRGRTAVITFDDGYVDNLAACEELKKRGMRASWFIVSGSVGRSPQWPVDGRPAGRLLNATELRVMQANGMEIGSHTVSHVRLPEIDDIRLIQELTSSKAALEDILGHAVDSFAYPYGAWDARCANAAQAAGYCAACTTRTGWAMRDGDPYRLRRLSIFNQDDLSSFARKLALASNEVSWYELAQYAGRRIAARLTASHD